MLKRLIAGLRVKYFTMPCRIPTRHKVVCYNYTPYRAAAVSVATVACAGTAGASMTRSASIHAVRVKLNLYTTACYTVYSAATINRITWRWWWA